MEPFRTAGPVEADAEVFVRVKERQIGRERESLGTSLDNFEPC